MNWLRIKRALGLAAPADGLCTWSWDQQEVTSTYREVIYRTNHYRCTLPWRHGPDHHAVRVDEQRVVGS